MGRTKQATPQRRTAPSEIKDERPNGAPNESFKKDMANLSNGHVKTESPATAASHGTFTELIICVGGIYMSL